MSQVTTPSLSAASHPAGLEGLQVGEAHKLVIGGGVRTITCNTATLSGTITAAADPLTLTPIYRECHAAPGNLPVTVTMNACAYSLTANTTGTSITGDLVCPLGKDVERHLYESEAKHAENVPLCAYTVQAQTNVPVGIYESIAGGAIRATVKASPTTFVTKGSKILCGAAAGGAVAATLEGTVDLTGKTDPGGAADALEVE